MQDKKVQIVAGVVVLLIIGLGVYFFTARDSQAPLSEDGFVEDDLVDSDDSATTTDEDEDSSTTTESGVEGSAELEASSASESSGSVAGAAATAQSLNEAAISAQYGEGDFVRAESLLRRAIEVDPSYEVSFINLASLYANSNLGSAESALLEGIEVNPQTVKLRTSLALYYKNQGDLEKAEEIYNEALSLAQARGNSHAISVIEEELERLEEEA